MTIYVCWHSISVPICEPTDIRLECISDFCRIATLSHIFDATLFYFPVTPSLHCLHLCFRILGFLLPTQTSTSFTYPAPLLPSLAFCLSPPSASSIPLIGYTAVDAVVVNSVSLLGYVVPTTRTIVPALAEFNASIHVSFLILLLCAHDGPPILGLLENLFFLVATLRYHVTHLSSFIPWTRCHPGNMHMLDACERQRRGDVSQIYVHALDCPEI